MADEPLKLLLPSLKLDFHDLIGLEGLNSAPLSLLMIFPLLSLKGLASASDSLSLILATTSWVIPLRQKGQTRTTGDALSGLGFLWQQRAKVQ